VFVNSANSDDTQLRERLVQMKEAKDAIETSFQDNIESQSLQPGGKVPHRKRSRLLDEVRDGDSDSSTDDAFLEPTPLAVNDAAYEDDLDGAVDDLGFKIGRMRLSERIGGLYRPRIADEVWLL
jgi:hypothetical protein